MQSTRQPTRFSLQEPAANRRGTILRSHSSNGEQFLGSLSSTGKLPQEVRLLQLEALYSSLTVNETMIARLRQQAEGFKQARDRGIPGWMNDTEYFAREDTFDARYNDIVAGLRHALRARKVSHWAT